MRSKLQRTVEYYVKFLKKITLVLGNNNSIKSGRFEITQEWNEYTEVEKVGHKMLTKENCKKSEVMVKNTHNLMVKTAVVVRK